MSRTNLRPVLVIVPCGKAKVWDREPERGAVAAQVAYVGGPFRANRAYAERFGDAWVILSAKHGFLAPDDLLPGPYEVTFNRRATNPVSVEVLKRQVEERGLGRFSVAVALGGVHYRAAVKAAFAGSGVQVVAPFAGLPLGLSLRATRGAVATGNPGWVETS